VPTPLRRLVKFRQTKTKSCTAHDLKTKWEVDFPFERSAAGLTRVQRAHAPKDAGIKIGAGMPRLAHDVTALPLPLAPGTVGRHEHPQPQHRNRPRRVVPYNGSPGLVAFRRDFFFQQAGRELPYRPLRFAVTCGTDKASGRR
jgi:hypothetical protein